MNVELRVRKTVKVSELQPGDTFKEVQKAACLQIIDLTQVDMFKNPGQDQKLLLRDDVVYAVDLSNGIVCIIPISQDVYRVNLSAKEVD
jgi:hypothetical protein